MADLARSLPWGKTTNDVNAQCSINTIITAGPPRKRRESSADSGIRSRRDSHASELARVLGRKESVCEMRRERDENNYYPENNRNGSRRNSNDSNRDRASRRDSNTATPPPPPKIVGVQKKRRDSLVAPEPPNFRTEQRPSTSSTASDSGPIYFQAVSSQVDCSTQMLPPPPTIVTSSVTPPATSPTAQKGRRDSTTQCGIKMARRDSRPSPERSQRLSKLQRQATAYDESCLPPGGWSRRGSGPALSPDGDGPERQARRDSLSPDSASRYSICSYFLFSFEE